MDTRAARSPPPAAGAASARLSILGLAPVFRKGRHANGAASAPVMACISQELEWSERRDLNPRPLVPQTSALTGLRYAPTPKGRCFSRCFVGGMQARSAGSRPRQGLERCRRERKGPESTAPPRFLQFVDIQPGIAAGRLPKPTRGLSRRPRAGGRACGRFIRDAEGSSRHYEKVIPSFRSRSEHCS